jgi:hypothetical protein
MLLPEDFAFNQHFEGDGVIDDDMAHLKEGPGARQVSRTERALPASKRQSSMMRGKGTKSR